MFIEKLSEIIVSISLISVVFIEKLSEITQCTLFKSGMVGPNFTEHRFLISGVHIAIIWFKPGLEFAVF